MQKPSPLIPEFGQRSLVIGQTGSGKTAFWVSVILPRVQFTPTIIYDTKGEGKFNHLKNSVRVHSWHDVLNQVDEAANDFIIFEVPDELLDDTGALDNFLWRHYLYLKGVAAYIDEVTSFTMQVRPSKGLTAMLTKGRSKGITLMMATQRPAFVPMFLYSETQAFYVFHIQLQTDKKKIDNFIPEFSELSDPPPHGFYFYKPADRRPPTRYGAAKLDRTIDTGYTDKLTEPGADTARRHVWH